MMADSNSQKKRKNKSKPQGGASFNVPYHPKSENPEQSQTPTSPAGRFGETGMPDQTDRDKSRGVGEDRFSASAPPQPSRQAQSGRSQPKTAPPQRGADRKPARQLVKLPVDRGYELLRLLLLGLLMVATIWSYFPVLGDLLKTWIWNVDYSHAFFILPLTVFFLWIRRDTYPGTSKEIGWLGLVPVAICVFMRVRYAYFEEISVEYWSAFFWFLGVFWFLYGNRAFFWALPSLLFLCFLFPLPYRFEYEMRGELQQYASFLATAILQTIGQPAIQVGNNIQINETQITVVNACSGLRFLISFFALASGAALLMRRPWWQNLFVFLAVFPIAILSNAARIALTALFMRYAPELMQSLANNQRNAGAMADMLAGYVMIFVAVAFFIGFLLYLGKLFRQIDFSGIAPATEPAKSGARTS